jgi:hypothetical protein
MERYLNCYISGIAGGGNPGALMFGNLLNTDRLQRIIMVAARQARAVGNWYLEVGCTQSEKRGINL